MANDGITTYHNLVITGTAPASSSVQVYQNGVAIGTTTAGASGNWTFDNTAVTLANGIYHRAVVLGEFTPGRPRELIIDVSRNGVAESTGADACALTGVPEDVLRHLGSHGADLQPGDVVITGAAVPPLQVTPGDVVVVHLPDIGEVSVRLT